MAGGDRDRAHFRGSVYAPRVRRCRGAATLVLMYHRIGHRVSDPLRHFVRPERFAEQIAALRGVADIVAPHRLLEPSDRPRVAITFDDGYADNLEHGVPVLESYDAPACIFVTNNFTPGAGEFWWDQLDHLLLDGDAGVPFVELPLAPGVVRFDVRSAAGRERTFALLNVVFRDLPPERHGPLLESLYDQLGRRPVVCDRHRLLDAAQVAAIDAGGLVEIGGHTAAHTALPLVDQVTAMADIQANRDALAAVTGRSPRLFAYPYGTYSRANAINVRRCGYDLAFLARPGTIWPFTSPMALPRMAAQDWTGEELLAALGPALR